MNIQPKYLAAIIAVSLAMGGYLSREMVPKIVVKTVTQTQTVDHDVTHDHIITVVKEVDNKDGTKEIDTTTTNNTVEASSSKVDATTHTTSSTPAPIPKPQWFITAGAGLDVSSLSNLASPIYNASVNHRFIGPIYLGAWVNTKTQAGVQLGLEF